MKLRQKLAVVMATAMVASCVPVVTLADSTNKAICSVKVIEKNDKTTAAALRITFEDANPVEEEEFYLTLTNAEWLDGTDDKEVIEGLGTLTVDPTNEDVWT